MAGFGAEKNSSENNGEFNRSSHEQRSQRAGFQGRGERSPRRDSSDRSSFSRDGDDKRQDRGYSRSSDGDRAPRGDRFSGGDRRDRFLRDDRQSRGGNSDFRSSDRSPRYSQDDRPRRGDRRQDAGFSSQSRFGRDDERGGNGRENRTDDRDFRGGARSERGGFKDSRRGEGFRSDRSDRGPRQNRDSRGERSERQDRGGRPGGRFNDRDKPRGGQSEGGTQDRRPQRAGDRPMNPRGPKAPAIDKDVTGKELDRATLAELRTLEAKNATGVAQHLVMVFRYLEDDPQRAYRHAQAAVNSAGRVSLVREAAGLAAYAAEDYAAALRELRTFRRITGLQIHLPVMADCERGVGKPEKALELAASEEAASLASKGQVEMAMVAAGALTDLGRFDEAVAALEIPQLDINRGFDYSPRLFRAYGQALVEAGREDESTRWFDQAVVAEKALGLDQEEEIDFYDAEEEFEIDFPEAAAAIAAAEAQARAERRAAEASAPEDAEEQAAPVPDGSHAITPEGTSAADDEA